MSKRPETPMMKQYNSIKEQYPDSILLYRMGDFYEMFFEDAIKASKALNIALTSRDKHNDEPIPMCGVPHHSVQSYLANLVKSGFNVAVCDQVEDPKQAKGIVKREVTRVITPGTLLEPGLLEAKEKNFLGAFIVDGQRIGFSFTDVSTAEFYLTDFEGKDAMTQFMNELVRLEPKEVLWPMAYGNDKLRAFLKRFAVIRTYSDEAFEYEFALDRLQKQFTSSAELDTLSIVAIQAGGACLAYLKDTQKSALSHIRQIVLYNSSEYMVVDEITKTNLELVKTAREGKKTGSLLSIIDETLTSMGGRKLHFWLLHPLLDPDRINSRLGAVELLKENFMLREDLRKLLKQISDLERLVSRVAMKSANAKDMTTIRLTLERLPDIKVLLDKCESLYLQTQNQRLDILTELCEFLSKWIKEDPPLSIKEGNIIREGMSSELDELREMRDQSKSFLLRLEKEERNKTGIHNLKVKFNKVFGYFIEVNKSYAEQVPENYIRKQTLVNAERFITPELKSFEEKILTAKERIEALEYELFTQVREEVAKFIDRLQTTADALATIDVLAGLAQLASERGYCRPDINHSTELTITNGRHPVVELLNPAARFTPNDTFMNCQDHQILLITGPNMSGKSTYIRQVALITLLAQMGSYVPAEAATVGMVDRIFTRVGASDNLTAGESTFMVEMLESARILKNATARSLIILDEIGRGTSTFDGLSLAWAIVEYIHDIEAVAARTLFATHYHELTDISITHSRVQNYSVAVKEHEDKVVFLHKVIKGRANKSYGIHVAELAGIPRLIIERSKEILANLEEKELDPTGTPILSSTKSRRQKMKVDSQVFQLSLFTADQDKLRQRLRALDPERMTPMEAMQVLLELKNMI